MSSWDAEWHGSAKHVTTQDQFPLKNWATCLRLGQFPQGPSGSPRSVALPRVPQPGTNSSEEMHDLPQTVSTSHRDQPQRTLPTLAVSAIPLPLPSITEQMSPNKQLLLLLLSRFSRVQLRATPQTAAHQAPPSLGFSRQEHWSGLPFPSPMHESESEAEDTLKRALQAEAGQKPKQNAKSV